MSNSANLCFHQLAIHGSMLFKQGFVLPFQILELFLLNGLRRL
jgi:hypothetical protein